MQKFIGRMGRSVRAMSAWIRSRKMISGFIIAACQWRTSSGTHVKIPVPSRILDVGAGYGHVPSFPARRFSPKPGFVRRKLDENCIAHLKSIGLPVLRPSGDLQKTVGDGFDLIICSHVIEHFINPMDHVREIKGMLRKGGHAYMEVPNCPAKWLKRNSWPDEPHITFFDADTVRDLATRVGFEIVSFHTVGPKTKSGAAPAHRIHAYSSGGSRVDETSLEITCVRLQTGSGFGTYNEKSRTGSFTLQRFCPVWRTAILAPPSFAKESLKDVFRLPGASALMPCFRAVNPGTQPASSTTR